MPLAFWTVETIFAANLRTIKEAGKGISFPGMRRTLFGYFIIGRIIKFGSCIKDCIKEL
jgi:hypothetical protein